jgi:hemolysin III
VHVGERFNSISHLVGAVLSVAGLVALVTMGALDRDPYKIVSFSVYGAMLILLYAISTLYHSVRNPRLKAILQKCDHSAIYLLIAGSYTPFALVTLQGPWGWALLASIWTVALLGIGRELRPGEAPKPSLLLYMGMGWLGVLAAAPLIERLDAGGLAWLMAGAGLYSAGTIFYRNPRGWRHAHGMWHLFVLGGTLSHYISVTRFVL